ncbi:hypothetical protein Pla175_19420 [Pirellulimonas nuda]|uniref:Uncharacterized protein n=1 Tax=Pirellulimonas nuda TaxID=2528009 RepID=A0A518DAQ7_9BACT|nr:hypothetical protein [Pirellulimonas nuda]QDU88564.1 hypothetical protein Pla175_19420 [Pirellulimonas nuda]
MNVASRWLLGARRAWAPVLSLGLLISAVPVAHAVTIVNAAVAPLSVTDVALLPGDPALVGVGNASSFTFNFQAANTSSSYLAVAIYKDDDVQDIAGITFNGSPATWMQQGRSAYAYGPVTDGVVAVEVTTAAVGLVFPADYNNDLATDAADYTVWRDNLDATLAPFPGQNPAATTPGVVDQEDYDFWSQNFGSTGEDVFDTAPWSVLAYQVNNTSGVDATVVKYDPAATVLPDPTDTQITTTQTSAILSVLFNDRTSQSATVFAGDGIIEPGSQTLQYNGNIQFVSSTVGTVGENGGVEAGTYNLFWDFPFTNQRRVGQIALALRTRQ